MNPTDRKRQDWRHNDRPGKPWHRDPLAYHWQCEARRCWRQRDRLGHWHARGRDMGTDDPGAGNRYHPECRPIRTLWDIQPDIQ